MQNNVLFPALPSFLEIGIEQLQGKSGTFRFRFHHNYAPSIGMYSFLQHLYKYIYIYILTRRCRNIQGSRKLYICWPMPVRYLHKLRRNVILFSCVGLLVISLFQFVRKLGIRDKKKVVIDWHLEISKLYVDGMHYYYSML